MCATVWYMGLCALLCLSMILRVKAPDVHVYVYICVYIYIYEYIYVYVNVYI